MVVWSLVYKYIGQLEERDKAKVLLQRKGGFMREEGGGRREEGWWLK